MNRYAIRRTLEPLNVDNTRWRWLVQVEESWGSYTMRAPGFVIHSGKTRSRERALRRMNRAETKLRAHAVLAQVERMNRETHTINQAGWL